MLFKKIFKDFISVAFGTTLARGIALANTIIIARMISPSDYGIFAVFYAVMILSWQFPGAFDCVFVALAKKSPHKSQKKDFLKSSLFFKLVYMIILMVLSYPLAAAISNHCFNKEALKWPIIFGFVCGSFLTFLITIASVYQEEERYARFGILHAVYTTAIFVGLVLLLFIGNGTSIDNIFLLYVSTTVIIGVFSFVIALRKSGNLLDVHRTILFKTFREGKWIFLSVSAYCIFEKMAMLVLPRFVPNEQVAIYAVAAQLASVVALAAGSLAGICLPRASMAVRSKVAFWRFVKESIYAILLIELGLSLCYFLAPFIVLFFYGAQYVSSVAILRMLLIGWSFGIIFIPFSFLFMAMEIARSLFLIEATKFCISFFACLLLIPFYGILGAAYAMAAAQFFSLIVSLILLKSALKAPFEKKAFSLA